MKNRENDDRVECFLTVCGENIFLIPRQLEELFESLPYYEQEEMFENYLLPDGIALESLLVEKTDLEMIREGDFY